MLIAYQGIAGAFGEEAVVARFGEEAERSGLASFAAVFTAVEEGRADAGVVPIENSLAGSILETWDLLLTRDVQVVGEVGVRVRHCLLALPGVRLEDVTSARSHPQALAQCARFLAQHGIEPVAAANTAVAAREVAAAADRCLAAIASRRAAAIHGLEILVPDVHGRGDNTTRFLVVQRERPADLGADKASLAFTTRNEPGALLSCLQVFADHDLNLTKLESRPTGEELWQYTFHADLETSSRGPLIQSALDAVVLDLTPRAANVCVFGRYERAR